MYKGPFLLLFTPCRAARDPQTSNLQPQTSNLQPPRTLILALALLGGILTACNQQPQHASDQLQMLFQGREYPFAICHNGTYYYTMQSTEDNIILYAVTDLHQLKQDQPKVVWTPDSTSLYHFWAPEIHRINQNWYIYFEADDGNTDNHQLYVIENTNPNPMEGTWTLKGVLRTNDEWNFGLHPNILDLDGELYLLWSGWPKRRVEHETQCIYIAHLQNPWTVDSERVMLSQPEYEWERQWIDPDGSRSAYPIFVNENPQAFLSPDHRLVTVCYSASGIWTRYHILGMLTAPAKANLLDPSVWTKEPEPVIIQEGVYGTSNICVVTSCNSDSLYLLYEALYAETPQDELQRCICLKTISLDNNGHLVFK